MVFKLVKVECTEGSKIVLNQGTYTFGRGKLLNVDDKRVSRNHGEFKVNDKLFIKALHVNPCFYLKKNCKEVQVLKCDNEIELCMGDRFGLLPNSHWFEVIVCDDVPSINNVGIMDVNEEATEDNNGQEHEDYDTDSGGIADQTTMAPSEVQEERNIFEEINAAEEETNVKEKNVTEDTNKEVGKTAENEIKEMSVIEDANEQEQIAAEEETNEKEKNVQEVEPNEQEEKNISEAETDFDESPNETSENEGVTDDGKTNTSLKRTSDDDEVSNKRVKCEPVDVKQEPEGEQPGSSSVNMDSNKNVNNLPPSPQKPTVRERCYYGAQCYRQNPQHRAQFSHPRDPDWGVGERGDCPFGQNCSKPDPRHWETHNHPPGVNRPAQRVHLQRFGKNIFIRAHTVNVYDDHISAEDSDGDSVDIDYEY